jgi:hypothetical protein
LSLIASRSSLIVFWKKLFLKKTHFQEGTSLTGENIFLVIYAFALFGFCDLML